MATLKNLYTTELVPQLKEELRLTGLKGLIVSGVFQDGPAHQAGLKPGDVIIDVNNMPAIDGRQTMNQIARLNPGDNVSMTLWRNGDYLKVEATTGVRPQDQANYEQSAQ